MNDCPINENDIAKHVRKAVNEARRNTHWLVPNEPWMEGLDRFVNAILMPGTGADFLASCFTFLFSLNP